MRVIDGATIHGRVNTFPDERVSNLLNRQEGTFLVVMDAADDKFKDKTLFINKEHIIWIEPDG